MSKVVLRYSAASSFSFPYAAFGGSARYGGKQLVELFVPVEDRYHGRSRGFFPVQREVGGLPFLDGDVGLLRQTLKHLGPELRNAEVRDRQERLEEFLLVER
jgi:hypothetical protein